MTKVSIHQSQYIPWPPYFKKIAKSDIFVIMDNVQYQKNGVQNRNRLRNKQDAFWLTIPVTTGHLTDIIMDKKLSEPNWNRKHWKSLEITYANSPNWHLYEDGLECLYSRQYQNLAEVNSAFLDYMLKCLDINTRIIKLSDLKISAEKSDLVLAICKELKAEIYISGHGAKNYLKENDFNDNGVTIEFLEYIPPVYKQFQGGFISGLSMLDMMFNVNVKEIAKYMDGSE